ncbi:4'-phosphopantetheinyl transferase superfamily protein [Streptomyces sp. NPDC032198]|uniref:4'-phosphopantetheinyl transferase family protein n=1 Tax=Streptomyces sp. NPDC032198 TaxID=3155127 RepID=UPI0033DBB2EE
MRGAAGRAGVHIWAGRVPDTAAGRDVALLDERETRRFERFRDEVTRARYAGARAAVRRTVAEWLGVEPSAVVWGVARCPGCGSDRHGPPYVRLPRTEWRTSVSRSGEWWMLALSYGMPVGVDLERRSAPEAPAVARRALTPEERAHVAAAREGVERDEALMRCWVRKEAVVKAWGVGLGTDLAAVAVRPWQDSAVVERAAGSGGAVGGGPESWAVRDVPVGAAGADCLAALARPAADTAPVVVHRTDAARAAARA